MTKIRRKTPTLRALALCTTAAVAVGQSGADHAAFAQQAAAELTLNIPAQDLGSALTRLADQSGMRLIVSSQTLAGKRSTGLSGSYSAQAAFSRLLSNTGLIYRFRDNSVIIEGTGDESAGADDFAPEDGLLLDPITIQGGQGEEEVYYTPGATAYISGQDLERFRGSSPADMFRGTPGVMSGEARNGAGSVDVNIRGMQGMGRVSTTVDGAENSMQVYQGYQGISNRTFVDPDLIADVEIKKGSDISSGGIAGSVAIRTVDAADIVEDGKIFGFKLKGEMGTNTGSPTPGNRAGYQFTNTIRGVGTATPSATGMDRPGLFEPTQGSGSAIAAMKTEYVDLLIGYSHRKRGNYYAGTNGPAASPEWIGGVGSSLGLYYDYVQNSGLMNYRAGEEVLNSELETTSLLAKATLRFGDGQSIRYSFNQYSSEAGDFLARRLTSSMSQAVQESQTTGTRLDSHTLKYRWTPAGNDMIDLNANLWISRLETLNPPRWGVNDPEEYGLPSDYRVGSNTQMWGISVDNRSVFDTGFGGFDLTYGVSYKNEDVKPRPFYVEIENAVGRDAKREQISAFASAAYTPNDWLTVDGGLRYDYFKSTDRRTDLKEYEETLRDGNRTLSSNGVSPYLGVTLEPWVGTQFFVNYSNALRLPSLFESSSSFVTINEDLKPERSRNWEIGVNHVHYGVFTDDDTGMVKLNFFDWDVKDYISRQFNSDEDGVSYLQMINIDRARFQGLELSAQYSISGFTAELAANYYTKVNFCRTASTCESATLSADYATNQVPPEYSVDLTLTQQLMNDDLTIGGRVSRVGPRAGGHGDPVYGASALIAMIDWEPYTLVDVFAEYKINKNITATFRVENLGDTYYVDPISVVAMPGPGRTVYAGLTARF
ncbi:TonB-dependent receptor domain-containing protein [Marinibacterium sp. SX1]|uniref:TonB-dependent receptor n=1 Tax=Marinibacterium sp. SX1 TaxID=3388424 RepID=UPI003D18364A